MTVLPPSPNPHDTQSFQPPQHFNSHTTALKSMFKTPIGAQELREGEHSHSSGAPENATIKVDIDNDGVYDVIVNSMDDNGDGTFYTQATTSSNANNSGFINKLQLETNIDIPLQQCELVGSNRSINNWHLSFQVDN